MLIGLTRTTEQAGLAGVALGLIGRLHGDPDRGQLTGAIGIDAIECAGPHQRLNHPPVDDAPINPATQIEQIAKGTGAARFATLTRGPSFACSNDFPDGRFTCALDRTQTVADGFFIHRHKAIAAQVDVRSEQLQAIAAAVLDQRMRLVGVIHHRRQVGRHERGRMMRLEIRRLIGHQRIGRCMRLVEAVAGEHFHQIEQVVSDRIAHAALAGALDEDAALLRHLLGLFLAHGTSQQIGGAE